MRTLFVPKTLILAGALVACGDDDPSNTPADVPTELASEVGTEVTPDAAGDATEQTLVITPGRQGRIRLYDEGAFAEFLADVTIIQLASTPECVAYIHNPRDDFATAGTVTIGGSILPAPITLDPGPNNAYEYLSQVLPHNDTKRAEVSLAGEAPFPDLPKRTYQPPASAAVVITAPPVPISSEPSSPVLIPTDEDLAIAWQVPSGDQSDHEVLFGLFFVQGDLGTEGALYCGFPMARGTGSVPAALLAEVERRTGEGAGGLVHIAAGDGERVLIGDTLYVVEVTRPADSASWINEYFAKLQ